MKKLALLVGALVLVGTLMTACGDTKTNTEGVYTNVPAYTEGVMTAEGYESAWSGIKFTATENIAMATEEELAEVDGIDDGSVYEMMATDNTNFDTVLVRTAELGEGITFEDYLAAQLEAIEEQYETNGLTVTYSEPEDVVFGGRAYKGALYTVSIEDVSIYQRVYRAMLGDRICEVYFTYSDDASFDALMNCFAK